jgi:3-oxosteroid 1-dehydrogenase
VDVIVIGSGAAGLAAGVAAAADGATVTVLEAAPSIGGTTAISGGGIWIPDNAYAEDSQDDALRYLRSVCLGDVDEELCRAYVENGMRVVRRIEAHSPLRWQLLRRFPDYHPERAGGKARGRSLEIEAVELPHDVLAAVRPDPYGGRPMTINEEIDPPDEAELTRRERQGIATVGRGLAAGLYHALLELGGIVRTGVRVDALRTAGGAVVGVSAAGEELEGAVIVASGGFERDDALVRTFLHGPMLAPAGPPSNRGDGLRLGMAAGAALGNMTEAWWCPALQVPGETIDGAPFSRMLFLDLAKPGGLLVDGSGRRFVNEAANYNELGRALHGLDASDYAYRRVPSWAVFDARRRASGRFGPAQPGSDDPPWLARAHSLEGLAGQVGLPARTLRETVERYNDGATRGVDDDFGRGSHLYDAFSSGCTELAAVSEAPFYAARVVPGCLGTKGGLRTDAHGRVLQADGGGVIPGLYAAGNAAANPCGTAYPGGGATIGPALVFGWTAGETALSSGSARACTARSAIPRGTTPGRRSGS